MRKKNQEYMKQPTRTKQLLGKSQLVGVGLYISHGLPSIRVNCVNSSTFLETLKYSSTSNRGSMTGTFSTSDGSSDHGDAQEEWMESSIVITVDAAEECDDSGYMHLANEFKESQKQEEERQRLQKSESLRNSGSRASRRFTMLVGGSVNRDPEPVKTSPSGDVRDSMTSQNEPEVAKVTKPLESADEVLDEALVRTIIDNDVLWYQIRRNMKNAKVVTSLGMNEICIGFVKDKAEEINKARIKQAKLPDNRFEKIRKRLSIFG